MTQLYKYVSDAQLLALFSSSTSVCNHVLYVWKKMVVLLVLLYNNGKDVAAVMKFCQFISKQYGANEFMSNT